MKKLVVLLLTCYSALAYAQNYTLILRNYEDRTYLVYIDDQIQYLEPRYGYTFMNVPISASKLTVATTQKISNDFDLQSLPYKSKQYIEVYEDPRSFRIEKSERSWNVPSYDLEPLLNYIPPAKKVVDTNNKNYKNKCELSDSDFQNYLDNGSVKDSDNDKLGYYKRNLYLKCISMSQLIKICEQIHDDKNKIILYQALENQLLESGKYKDYENCITKDYYKKEFLNFYFSKSK